eukprot:6801337-Alexandrium_andersonii.AAC.2
MVRYTNGQQNFCGIHSPAQTLSRPDAAHLHAALTQWRAFSFQGSGGAQRIAAVTRTNMSGVPHLIFQLWPSRNPPGSTASKA